MKYSKRIIVCCGVIFFMFSSIFIVNAISNKPVDQTEEFADIMGNNPFIDSDKKERTIDDNIYAKGEHIVITQEEMSWQTDVFQLNGSTDPQGDAYQQLCVYKTLIYAAQQAGFSITDQELEEHIEYMIESYEEYKKDGFTDNLYEAYGGAENYENMTKEATRDSLLINKYLASKKELYNSTLDSSLDDMERQSKWLDERKKIEQKLVESEKITIIE